MKDNYRDNKEKKKWYIGYFNYTVVLTSDCAQLASRKGRLQDI